ncbi:hypothetical protein BaRGS_00034094 [Batillaria attramentaria]|uniref:Uncharacterized protein n=1 Tax=Batillaria attramentaria TaxID=370345 RepID=A0ABD0JJ57_9CAEN
MTQHVRYADGTEDAVYSFVNFTKENLTQCFTESRNVRFNATAGRISWHEEAKDTIDPEKNDRIHLFCSITFILPPDSIAYFRVIKEAYEDEPLLWYLYDMIEPRHNKAFELTNEGFSHSHVVKMELYLMNYHNPFTLILNFTAVPKTYRPQLEIATSSVKGRNTVLRPFL